MSRRGKPKLLPVTSVKQYVVENILEESCKLTNRLHAVCFRVSSVLNRDVKQFGKKHLFDDDEETCWNSDQVIYLLFMSYTVHRQKIVSYSIFLMNLR